jgi:hypothetical protein
VGVAFGGGVSLGKGGCDRVGCLETRMFGVVEGHFGVFIAPRLALVAEAWGSSIEIGDATRTRAFGGLGVRGSLSPRVWLSLSAGAASFRSSPSLERVEMRDVSALKPAAAAAVGYVVHTESAFEVDVHVRGAVALAEDAVDTAPLTVGAGITWN